MTQSDSPLNLQALEGTWYIHFSDFPMWLKGDKQYPTFTYTIRRRKGVVGLKDEVRYLKNNKAKSINGFDVPVGAGHESFVWRGDGLLALLKSKWDIVYLDPAGTWAIIHFEKTLFTPEGYDVMARNGQLSEKVRQEIQEKLSELGLLSRMKAIAQK
ncbi:lipocalin family protein [Salmonirosea aquatica]|uniref:Lipocalin/cytosolic fatty-acid binding domain-containing protein n=1 Tax=Salmonirosea aquatica TaxID=2654236 RepID=A0A7C9BKU9_9BACT|nr:hypothetical protein [Cytophagaceae bacterium SJW1-29]